MIGKIEICGKSYKGDVLVLPHHKEADENANFFKLGRQIKKIQEEYGELMIELEKKDKKELMKIEAETMDLIQASYGLLKVLHGVETAKQRHYEKLEKRGVLEEWK